MRLIDADVIIWNWRGQEDAALLLADSPFAVSAVTYMELVQGMRNRREFAKLRADLKLWQVRLLPVTEPISARAVALVERHFLPHHVQLADAFDRSRVCGSKGSGRANFRFDRAGAPVGERKVPARCEFKCSRWLLCPAAA